MSVSVTRSSSLNTVISKYGGTDVKVNGEDQLILSQSDILGVLED